jgi:hypothetical protein
MDTPYRSRTPLLSNNWEEADRGGISFPWTERIGVAKNGYLNSCSPLQITNAEFDHSKESSLHQRKHL